MRGLPGWNFPAFDRAAEVWREAGHQPFSPAQVDRALGYGPDLGESDSALRHVMALDLACISHADAIALLPGWEDSAGATVELAFAQFLGLPVYDALTREFLNVSKKPWRYAPAGIHVNAPPLATKDW